MLAVASLFYSSWQAMDLGCHTGNSHKVKEYGVTYLYYAYKANIQCHVCETRI